MNSEERKRIIAESPISFSYLKRFNTAAGILHLVQGIIMLVVGLQLDWSRDIYTVYTAFNATMVDGNLVVGNPAIYLNPQVLLNITYLGAILASFPLLSAIAHFLIAYPKNNSYNENLKKGMNPYRWYEYSLSSSIMIVLIALFLGIWDIWSLVMIFVLNAMMIMFGYLMEIVNQKTEKTSWSAFILGSISGFTPWVVLYAYFIALIQSTGLEPPTFVYMILFIYFFMFNIFAVNMILQYKGVGRWRDYLYGERFYIILSFVAKSILSWLVFIGIFAPF